jgi:hypothetical protein
MQYPNQSHFILSEFILMQDGAMCQNKGSDKGKTQAYNVSNCPCLATGGFSDAFTAIYCQILSRV